jgi:hypothetical protein
MDSLANIFKHNKLFLLITIIIFVAYRIAFAFTPWFVSEPIRIIYFIIMAWYVSKNEMLLRKENATYFLIIVFALMFLTRRLFKLFYAFVI